MGNESEAVLREMNLTQPFTFHQRASSKSIRLPAGVKVVKNFSQRDEADSRIDIRDTHTHTPTPQMRAEDDLNNSETLFLSAPEFYLSLLKYKSEPVRIP